MGPFETISSDALEGVTRRILAQDLIRLYLCGSRNLNASMERGGVKYIDNSTSAPCGYFKLGKSAKFPDFDWSRPETFSSSFVRFQGLRSLTLFLKSLDHWTKLGFLSDLPGVERVELHLGSTKLPSQKWHVLPPNLTSLEIYTAPGCDTIMGAVEVDIPMVRHIPTLTSVKLASAFNLSFHERYLLPRSALFLNGIVLPITWRDKGAEGPLLPPDLQTLQASHALALKLPAYIDQPDFFPRTLTDLDLTCHTAINFSYLPMTIVSLKLKIMKATFETIFWEPMALETFHYTTTKFWVIDPVEGPRTPVFDWIYGQKTIIDLLLSSSATGLAPDGSRFNLSRLPISVQRLSLQGAATNPRSVALPSNLPETLVSLKIQSGLDSLLHYAAFPDDLSEEQLVPHRAPFELLESLTVAFPFWRIPHSAVFNPMKLKHLTVIGALSSDLAVPSFWQNLPPTLETVDFEEKRLVMRAVDLGPIIHLLPTHLKALHIRHHHIFISKPDSWPEGLTSLNAPFCDSTFSAIKEIPQCLTSLTLKCVSIDERQPQQLGDLQEWMDARPFARLFGTWVLPTTFLPTGAAINNPLKLMQAISSLPAFKHSNWLSHMPWTVSTPFRPPGHN